MFRLIFCRELRLFWADRVHFFSNLLFFFALNIFAIFAFSEKLSLLPLIAPSLLWLSFFFTLLLHLDLLLKQDIIDGTLEQLFLGQNFLCRLNILLAKSCAHWLSHIAPLLCYGPFLALALKLPCHVIAYSILLLAIISLPLLLLGLIGTSLSLILQQSPLLSVAITLPFASPLLIFGIDSNYAFINERDYHASLAILLGLAGLYLIFCPLFTLYILRSLWISD